MRSLAVILFLLLSVNITPLKAMVVEDTNVIFTKIDESFFDADYSLSAYFSPTTMYDTLFINKTDNVSHRNSTLTPTNWTVAYEADYYLVPYGAEFRYETISSGQFKPLFVLDTPGSLTIPYGRFYLGINTGPTFELGPDRDVFGWALFSLSSTELRMLDNAMAYETNGIYIGTTTTLTTSPVPVPGAAFLLGSGLVGLVGLRRKKRLAVA